MARSWPLSPYAQSWGLTPGQVAHVSRMFSSDQAALESPGGLVNTKPAGPTPKEGVGELRMCISDRFPGDSHWPTACCLPLASPGITFTCFSDFKFKAIYFQDFLLLSPKWCKANTSCSTRKCLIISGTVPTRRELSIQTNNWNHR